MQIIANVQFYKTDFATVYAPNFTTTLNYNSEDCREVNFDVRNSKFLVYLVCLKSLSVLKRFRLERNT
ncbi:hypothetical protein BpHYR1_019496 [Brachionus plicatilis]|uniref:Uncharacterized protein n=1 Tax=Brachionus plicatilis TaxID=10195 RepID=A0A3M7S1U1_BRAPC|nr:hypothetical protein BpHYR1_019496 [Brachionus plicatilis]